MELFIGDTICSLAGRDRNRLAFIVGLDAEYVWIADGKCRKLEHPKQKKKKHVKKVSCNVTRSAELLRQGTKVLNSDLRRDLALISKQSESQNQGGF